MQPRPTPRAFRPSLLVVAAALSLGAVGGACKGKTEYKDSPATQDRVKALEAQLGSKDTLISDYEARITALERGGSGAGGELTITFVDDVLKVSPGHGSRPSVDDAAAAAMSQAFIDVVQRSRGAIQKCYEGALKKNTSLQAKTVSFTISATFSAPGAFQKASFSKSLGEPFDSCLQAVAGKWKMPASEQAVTFRAPVSLSPT